MQLGECTLVCPVLVGRLDVGFIASVRLCEEVFLNLVIWLVKLSHQLLADLEVLVQPLIGQLALTFERLLPILRE